MVVAVTSKNRGDQKFAIPLERKLVEDSGHLGSNYHTYHLIVEADVTEARQWIKQYKLH